MLLKSEREFLKILRNNKPDMPRKVFSYTFLKSFYKSDTEKLYSVVRSLSSKEPKLIGIAKNQDDISLGVYLENTGIHFREYLAIKISSAIFFYVAGILSAVIATYLSGLF